MLVKSAVIKRVYLVKPLLVEVGNNNPSSDGQDRPAFTVTLRLRPVDMLTVPSQFSGFVNKQAGMRASYDGETLFYWLWVTDDQLRRNLRELIEWAEARSDIQGISVDPSIPPA